MAPQPLPFKRLPFLHHFQMWAPKLGRQVTLATPATVRLWALLEADPAISDYCERPAVTESGGEPRFIDFWARRGDGEEWWVLEGKEESELAAADGEPIPRRPFEGVVVIPRADLEKQQTWIDNWLSMLPYLSVSVRQSLLDRSRAPV